MKNYKHDIESTNWPWCESPFFYDLLEHQNLSEEDKQFAIDFHENGYAIIDLELSDDAITDLVDEIDKINSEQDVKVQEQGYHYSKGKRIFEGWKRSKLLKSLSLNQIVLNKLNILYKKPVIPFQTITFNYGSNQPFHSDVIHFHSMPHRWLAACWVALEKMDENNGSLVYIPGSHKLPIFDFYDLKIKAPEYGKQFDSYAEYENFIQQLVDSKELKTETLICNPGQALLWSANLIHGGAEIKDQMRTRYSQVTHYYFEGCDKYFSPMFSEAWMGKFSEKKLEEKNFYE
jgi:ectoine hydroxylase-related dioxygenase (phytanoyl-CoA dioxygenase family)